MQLHKSLNKCLTDFHSTMVLIEGGVTVSQVCKETGVPIQQSTVGASETS